MLKDFALFRVGKKWHYRHQLPGQPRMQRSTGETSRARAEVVAVEAFEAAKLRARGDEPCPTVEGLVHQWLEAHQETASPAHLKVVANIRKNHLGELGGMRLHQVHTRHVEEARALYLEAHSPASANQWLNVLRLLFNWAIRRRMIRVREWQVKLLKVQRRPRVILPPSDTPAWLAAVDRLGPEGMGTAIRLSLGLGLREMEAVRARWEWMDWDLQVYRPGETKGREARPRPIPGWLLDFLKNEHRQLGHPRSGWMAPGPEGNPYHEGRMRRVMAKANAAVGIKGLTPHRLRGTYITLLLASKVPLQDVSNVVGHADWKTTLGYAETDLGRVRVGQDEIASKASMVGRRIGAAPHAKQATKGVD